MTPYDLAQRFVGITELKVRGMDHPLIQWALSLCGFPSDVPDETPWCSAFVNMVAWCLRLPRSKSAAARSWLTVGVPVRLAEAFVGSDVVVLKRGGPNEPGPDVLNARGHVGFYAGREGDYILVLGGNQGDSVSIARFDVTQLLGIRRLGAMGVA